MTIHTAAVGIGIATTTEAADGIVTMSGIAMTGGAAVTTTSASATHLVLYRHDATAMSAQGIARGGAAMIARAVIVTIDLRRQREIATCHPRGSA